MLVRKSTYERDVNALRNALEAILAQKTPSANATVTRMANIAENALLGV